MLCLYNLHEKYLNRLLVRYHEGLIPDLTTFLSETWALPIYHDHFQDFMRQSRKEMISAAHKSPNKMPDHARLLEHLASFAASSKALQVKLAIIFTDVSSCRSVIDKMFMIASTSPRSVIFMKRNCSAT